MARAVHYRLDGSGPVALACALFMVRGGIAPARVQLTLPSSGTPRPRGAAGESAADVGGEVHEPAVPRRMLALSDGSRQLLGRIIAMPAGGVIERIEVVLCGRTGRTRIEARDFGVAALGHVIAYPDLMAALAAAASRIPFAASRMPFAPSRIPLAASQDSLSTPHASSAAAGDDPVSAGAADVGHVAIHAEGMPRQADGTGQALDAREFRQVALLTEVMAQPAGTTAYECFGSHGPLALLPAAHGQVPRYAVVWCDEPAVTAERADMSREQLSEALTKAFSACVESRSAPVRLRVCAPVSVAPLARTRRVDSVAGCEVWIGNAAQALHPVAGQGLNLGLRDAFELARALADNEFAAAPLAPARVLHRFAARRRTDRTITTAITDLLADAFTWPLARPLQSSLLTAMDLLPPVRKPLASVLLFGNR